MFRSAFGQGVWSERWNTIAHIKKAINVFDTNILVVVRVNDKLDAVLARVPDVPPVEGDEMLP